MSKTTKQSFDVKLDSWDKFRPGGYQTAVYESIKAGDLEVFEYLLTQGMKVDPAPDNLYFLDFYDIVPVVYDNWQKYPSAVFYSGSGNIPSLHFAARQN